MRAPSPTRRGFLAGALGLALASTLGLGEAHARGKVEWKAIVVRSAVGKEPDALVKVLRPLLQKAAKKADFGRKQVTLSARVVEFRSEAQGDVHRVSCTIVGRLEGGASAKSKISFGGHPGQRDKLEKQVLGMVASGVVARLATLAREQKPAKG